MLSPPEKQRALADRRGGGEKLPADTLKNKKNLPGLSHAWGKKGLVPFQVERRRGISHLEGGK